MPKVLKLRWVEGRKEGLSLLSGCYLLEESNKGFEISSSIRSSGSDLNNYRLIEINSEALIIKIKPF